MSHDAHPDSLTVHFAAETSACGVSRATWRLVADRLGISETDAIQLAMVQLASKTMENDMKQGFPAAADLGNWNFEVLSRAVAKAVPDEVDGRT